MGDLEKQIQSVINIYKSGNLIKAEILAKKLGAYQYYLQTNQNIKTEFVYLIDGIKDYVYYKPKVINENIIINEPNLYEQPKYYQNTENQNNNG